MAKRDKANHFFKWVKETPPLQVLALILAGPAISGLILLILLLTVFAGWELSQQGLQLEILREGLAYSFIILLIIIGALTAGLVRGFKVGVGKVTAELDLADDDDDQEVKARVQAAENERLSIERRNTSQVEPSFTPSFESHMNAASIPSVDEFTAPDPEEPNG